MQTIASDMDKNQESTTYREVDEAMWVSLREALGELACIADPESVKPVENPQPATDPESATEITP